MSEASVAAEAGACAFLPAPPVIEPLRQRADELIAELTRAFQTIRTRTEEFLARQAELACKCDEFERQAAELDRRTAQLEERDHRLSVQITELETKNQAINEREQKLAEDYRGFLEAKEMLDADRAAIETQQEVLDTQRAAFVGTQAELTQAKAHLERERRGLADREAAHRDLESSLHKQAAELEAMRDSIRVVTDQLERERHELAGQRAELVSRFNLPADALKERVGSAGSTEPEFEAPQIKLTTPQPLFTRPTPPRPKRDESSMQSAMSEQFRKLRRDARRRVKGMG